MALLNYIHLLPAHAGVILPVKSMCRVAEAAPRARGGDPLALCTVVGVVTAPRARGGDPIQVKAVNAGFVCSPRTRG